MSRHVPSHLFGCATVNSQLNWSLDFAERFLNINAFLTLQLPSDGAVRADKLGVAVLKVDILEDHNVNQTILLNIQVIHQTILLNIQVIHQTAPGYCCWAVLLIIVTFRTIIFRFLIRKLSRNLTWKIDFYLRFVALHWATFYIYLMGRET